MDALWEVASTCGACAHHEWQPAGAIHGHRYGRCAGCGVVRLVDRLAPAHLGLLYDGYYPTALPTGDALERDLANPTFAWRRRRLETAIGRLTRRIFEVGCGDGNFLLALQRAGWGVTGCEHGDTARMVRQRHGLPVTGADVLDGPVPGAPFPAVAAYHVLEHIYRPADWLAAVHGIIEAGGLLHLQVPNYAALTRRVTGESWASWCFPQHVYFYTPATLQRLLTRSGFSVEDSTTWDPWHGPGTAMASLANRARRLAGAGSPWSDDIRPQAAASRADARPALTQPPPRPLLRAGSHAWAMVEAMLGRGAVVDVIARCI